MTDELKKEYQTELLNQARKELQNEPKSLSGNSCLKEWQPDTSETTCVADADSVNGSEFKVLLESRVNPPLPPRKKPSVKLSKDPSATSGNNQISMEGIKTETTNAETTDLSSQRRVKPPLPRRNDTVKKKPVPALPPRT